jgi:hypothetical protein
MSLKLSHAFKSRLKVSAVIAALSMIPLGCSGNNGSSSSTSGSVSTGATGSTSSTSSTSSTGSTSGTTGTTNSTSGTSGTSGTTSSTGSTGNQLTPLGDPGFTQTTTTPLTFGITVSGETLGEQGLPFCPVSDGDPYFVDGWNFAFSNYIVVVDNIRLNENPTKDSTWQDMGAQVAIKKGPFVIDIHNCGNGGFIGKDGEEPAQGIFLWTKKDDGTPFDPSVRYAFSYDIVQATYPAINVNLSSDESAIYDKMVKNHWSKYVAGTVTSAVAGTYSDATDPNEATAQANFAAFPTAVQFAFGWDDHTQILNCVNADLGAEDDLANRGIQANPNGMYIAQITIHTDHLFWDTLEHEGEPLRFDPIAAFVNASLAYPDGGSAPFATTFDLNSNNFAHQPLATIFDDGNSTPLPDRGPYQPNTCPNAGGQFTTDMGNGHQVVMNTNGVTTIDPNDYRTFMMFSVQSQAHLNAQGLCYIVGQHASDPYYHPVVNPEVQ